MPVQPGRRESRRRSRNVGARGAVKEHHFHQRERSAKHHLIDVAPPRAVRVIAELSIEVKLGLHRTGQFFTQRNRGPHPGLPVESRATAMRVGYGMPKNDTVGPSAKYRS